MKNLIEEILKDKNITAKDKEILSECLRLDGYTSYLKEHVKELSVYTIKQLATNKLNILFKDYKKTLPKQYKGDVSLISVYESNNALLMLSATAKYAVTAFKRDTFIIVVGTHEPSVKLVRDFMQKNANSIVTFEFNETI